VLCEKPFTVSAQQANEVIAAARSRKLFCMEAMWMRFQPLIKQVRLLVQSGSIGQVRLLEASFGYTTPFDPQGRFFSRALGGGTLLDRGVYLLTLARLLLGPPQETVGRASIGPTGVDEQTALILTYPTGGLGVLTASLRSHLRNEAVITGTEGQIRIHEPFFAPRRVSWEKFTEPVAGAAQERSAPAGWIARLKRQPVLRRGYERIARPALRLLRRRQSQLTHHAAGRGYQYEAAEVMRCLRAGETESPLQTLDETLAILEAMDALRRSWSLVYPGENG
jgi:predicted dehydrogenase